MALATVAFDVTISGRHGAVTGIVAHMLPRSDADIFGDTGVPQPVNGCGLELLGIILHPMFAHPIVGPIKAVLYDQT